MARAFPAPSQGALHWQTIRTDSRLGTTSACDLGDCRVLLPYYKQTQEGKEKNDIIIPEARNMKLLCPSGRSAMDIICDPII